MAGADDRDYKKRLLRGLGDLLWKVVELEEIVKDFGPESQPVLEERMCSFAASVKDVASGIEHDTRKIPVDLLKYMDEGGNPNQYTADVFNACLRDNQASKGKVMAVKTFRDQLMSELEQQMPEQTAEYKALLATHNQNNS